MRKYLRACLFCLIFTLAICTFAISANAQESTLDENINFRLYDKLLGGILAGQEDILIADGHYSVEELHATFNYISTQEPDIFYVGNAYKYTLPEDRSYVISFRPTYLYGREERAQKTADFNQRINAILALVDPAWSDVEKVVFLHEYVCSNFTYDDSYEIADAYEMLLHGRGVCQGYTLLLNKLLTKLGIPCESVFSNAANHVWNEVFINGKWYHLDATWNDDLDDYTYDDFAYHDHLLASTSQLLSLEPIRSDMQYRYACTDTTYDKTALQKVTSEIVFLDGDWYGAADKIYRFNLQNGTAVAIADLPKNWHATHSTYINGIYTCLFAYEGVLLYNTDTAICYYNPLTGTSGSLRTPISSYYYFYGFSLENGIISYTLGNSPSRPRTQTATFSAAEALTVSVTYTAGGVTVKTQQYTRGDRLVLPKTPFTYKENGNVYIIVGFDNANEGEAVTNDRSINVTLGDLPLYTVNWIIDGVTYEEKYVLGELPICPFDTSKIPTEEIYYAFDGFYPTPTAVTGDATYTARYREERNYYFAYLIVNGTTTMQRVVRGQDPVFPVQAPQKAPYDRFVYTFSHWELESTADNGDRTYRASFTEIALYQYSAEAFIAAAQGIVKNNGLTIFYSTLSLAYRMSLSVNLEMDGANEAKEAVNEAISLYQAQFEQRQAEYFSDLQTFFEISPFGYDVSMLFSQIVALLPNKKIA